MINLSLFRKKAKGYSDLLPYAALIEPDLLLNKDGSLFVAYEVFCRDTESMTPNELAGISARVNLAMKYLDSSFMLQCDAIRLQTKNYIEASDNHFPDKVSQFIDDERRAIFSSGSFYSTSIIIGVTYKSNTLDKKLQKLVTNQHDLKNNLERSIENFKKSLVNLEDILSTAMQLERLGSEVFENGSMRSALLSYIQLTLTGEEYIPYLPHTPMYLDVILGGQDFFTGMQPKIGKKHIAVLALDSLPSESFPAMLSFLNTLPFECRFNTRFICLDQAQALREVSKQEKTWAQKIFSFKDKVLNTANPKADQDALLMSQEAKDVYTSVQTGYIGAGFYTANIVLMNEDRKEIEEEIRIIKRAIVSSGFGVRLEEINAVEAFLGTHPANSFANVRRPIITTLNLADFLPLHTPFAGLEHNPSPFYPKKSPPLTICQTDNSTPFRLNLHSGDIGHTLIAGGTGSGKSTLLALIAAQFLRYPKAQIFAFDKGNSLEALAHACNGLHYNIASDDSPNFSPLQFIDSSVEMASAEEFIEACLSLAPVTVLPGHRIAIHKAMVQLSKMPKELRTLTLFCIECQNEDVKEALKHYTVAGSMGHLLDSKVDGLGESNFTVFEIETLMGMGEKNLLPVLMYLFKRIENSLKGQPSILILDEAWLMLGHPFFASKIREWLKDFRKKNCAVILATQNLSDLARSGIMDVIIENTVNIVLLANDKADEPVSKQLYENIGVNDVERHIVKNLIPKREYYFIQREGRRQVSLALTNSQLCFVGASGKEDLANLRICRKTHGEDWQEEWILERTGVEIKFSNKEVEHV